VDVNGEEEDCCVTTLASVCCVFLDCRFSMCSWNHWFLQIGVGPNDDSWIYGSYVCRATNFLGSNTTTVQL